MVKSLWRAALIVLLLACVPLYVLQYSLVPKTGDFGVGLDAFSANAPSVTLHVLSVEPNSPASRAGLRPGDLIPLAHADRATRVALTWTLPGDQARVEYVRGGHVYHAHLIALPNPPYPFAAPDAIRSAVVFCVFTFALLVTLRAWHSEHGPLIATILTMLIVNPATDALPSIAREGIVLWVWWALHIVAGAAGLFGVFLAVVLAGRLIDWRDRSFRFVTVLFAIEGAAFVVFEALQPAWQLNGRMESLGDVLSSWDASVSYLIAALCLILAYRAAHGDSRQRLRWIFWGFLPFLVSVSVLNLPPLIAALSVHPGVALVVNTLLRLMELSLPVSLFYGVLLRRAVDVGFVFNRVAVYGILSIVLFSIFVLLEYAASRLFLDTGRFGSLAIQLSIALLIGFSARYSHSVVDRFVDRILFAQRHECESALRRFAREAEAYTSTNGLLDRALEKISENSEARGVAIYLVNDGHAGVVRSTGEHFPQRVELDDELLVSLRRWGEPVDTRDVKTAFPDGMVFPISARGRLLGALLCETKRDFSAFAPDERDSLLEVSRGVALALDSLEHDDGQSGVLDAIGDLARRIDALISTLPKKLGAD